MVPAYFHAIKVARAGMGALLDAYRADLTNAGKETFSALDALWLQCGAVLQRALELEPAVRQSCLATGLRAILDQPGPATMFDAIERFLRAPDENQSSEAATALC